MSRLERGLENPTIALLEQLADALGAKIAELLPANLRRNPSEAAVDQNDSGA